MSYASVQNAEKSAFIEPTLDSISAASSGVANNLPAAEDSWVGVSLVNAPGSDSYPIASFTYLLLYDDLKPVTNNKEQAKAIIHIIHWMITDGQEFSSSLLYVPLADKVTELGKQGLSKVTYDGESIWTYEADASTNLGIPQWIRDNAKWWSEGLITDQDYINGLQYLIQQGILKV
jgi:hypothetical protein